MGTLHAITPVPRLTAVVGGLGQPPHQACQVSRFKLIQLHSRPPPQRRLHTPQQRAGRAVAQPAECPQRPGQCHRRAGGTRRLRCKQLLQPAGRSVQGRRRQLVPHGGKCCTEGRQRGWLGSFSRSEKKMDRLAKHLGLSITIHIISSTKKHHDSTQQPAASQRTCQKRGNVTVRQLGRALLQLGAERLK